MFFALGRSFLPSFNEGSFTINISSLPGISLAESDKMGHRAEAVSYTHLPAYQMFICGELLSLYLKIE